MAIEIKVPTLGESVSEATVARWLKAEGDSIGKDENLAELETDKVTLDVPSPVSGKVVSLAVAEGATVDANAVLAVIEEGADGAATAPAPAAKPAPEPAKSAPAPAAKSAPEPAKSAPASAPSGICLYRRRCGVWWMNIILTRLASLAPVRMGV